VVLYSEHGGYSGERERERVREREIERGQRGGG